MKEIYLIYFKSGSCNEYFMKTKDPSCTEWTAEDFVKKYIPYEYDDDGFLYLNFNIYALENNEIIIYVDNDTCYKIHPDDLNDYDVAYDINETNYKILDTECDCN